MADAEILQAFKVWMLFPKAPCGVRCSWLSSSVVFQRKTSCIYTIHEEESSSVFRPPLSLHESLFLTLALVHVQSLLSAVRPVS